MIPNDPQPINLGDQSAEATPHLVGLTRKESEAQMNIVGKNRESPCEAALPRFD